MRKLGSSRRPWVVLFTFLLSGWMVLAVTGQAAAAAASGQYVNYTTGKYAGLYAWSDNCIYDSCIVPEGPNRVAVTDYNDSTRTIFRMYAKGSGTVYYKYVDTLVPNNYRIVRYLSTMPVGAIKFEFCPINSSGAYVGACTIKYAWNS